MKKSIEKKDRKLSVSTRIKLVFGILPDSLEEVRAVFKANEFVGYSPSLSTKISLRLQGKTEMYGELWMNAYKKWVALCGKDSKELKGAFFSTAYHFEKMPHDNPLRNIVVPVILRNVEYEQTRTLHVSEPDLYYLASGAAWGQPYSEWQQAALLKWCAYTEQRRISERSYLFVRGSAPYNYARKIGVILLESEVKPGELNWMDDPTQWEEKIRDCIRESKDTKPQYITFDEALAQKKKNL